MSALSVSCHNHNAQNIATVRREFDNLQQLYAKLADPNFTFDSLKATQNVTKALLKGIAQSDLDQFITKMIEWGIAQEEPLRIFSLLGELVDCDQLFALAQQNNLTLTSLHEWTKERVDCFPALPEQPSQHHWGRSNRRVLYFIPNLINLAMNTLSYLDSYRKFTSLWDRFSLFDIFYKVVLIPYGLVKVLTPLLVTTTKVYLATALIITGVGLAMAAYKKWVMPIPQQLLTCVNLDERMKLGLIEPKVGEPIELERIKEALLAGSNILLIGKTGSGKTALIEQLVQHKKDNTLPPELQKLHYFLFDCAALRGSNTYGYTELIYQTKDQIDGNEGELLLFFDELNQIASDQSCIEAFKTHFLNRGQGPRIIGAITPEGYKQIEKLLEGSVGRRIIKINLLAPSKDRMQLILRDFLNREASDLPFDEEAIDKTIELVESSPDYQKHIGSVAKAKLLMEDMIGRCRLCYTDNYSPPELLVMREQYRMLTSNPQNLVKIKELKGKIVEYEAKLEKQKIVLAKIKHFTAEQRKAKRAHSYLTQQLASSTQAEAAEKDKKLYMLYEFYGTEHLKTHLNKLLEKVTLNGIEKKIDVALVQRVFDESVALQKQLAGAA